MTVPARPPDLFDRHHEWAELSAFVSDPTPGLRIGIVYGRRRQGKSYPLRRLAAAMGGFYYQALEHEPAQALAELGDRLGAHLGVGRLAFADWDEAVSSLRRLAPRLSGAIGSAPLGTTPLPVRPWPSSTSSLTSLSGPPNCPHSSRGQSTSRGRRTGPLFVSSFAVQRSRSWPTFSRAKAHFAVGSRPIY
jgi:hypothetical protein